MLYDTSRWIRNFLFFVAGLFLISSTVDYTTTVKKRYHIQEGSKLYLKGTSNVNKFTCECQDQYTQQVLEVERKGGYARFHNVNLHLKSKKFDCHNRKIDNDIQKALQAEQYPHIKIALIDTWQNAKCLEGDCKDWFDVQAKVKITITNVTKEQSIAAKARMIGPNRFELQGEHALQMSAYGINPPEAMFGMIKVNDWITFHFNLIVHVDEAQL